MNAGHWEGLYSALIPKSSLISSLSPAGAPSTTTGVSEDLTSQSWAQDMSETKPTRTESTPTRPQTTTRTDAYPVGTERLSAGVAEAEQVVATASFGTDAQTSADTTLRSSVEKEVGREGVENLVQFTVPG